jgi:hypothetical protein
MKANKSHSYNELKAGVTEQELIRAAEEMINDYLLGDIPRSEVVPLVDEFERLVREEYPNPQRTGCPRSQTLRERNAGNIAHIRKCWPCLKEYSLFHHI